MRNIKYRTDVETNAVDAVDVADAIITIVRGTESLIVLRRRHHHWAETGAESCAGGETKFCKRWDLLGEFATNEQTGCKTKKWDQRSFGIMWKSERERTGTSPRERICVVDLQHNFTVSRGHGPA